MVPIPRCGCLTRKSAPRCPNPSHVGSSAFFMHDIYTVYRRLVGLLAGLLAGWLAEDLKEGRNLIYMNNPYLYQ